MQFGAKKRGRNVGKGEFCVVDLGISRVRQRVGEKENEKVSETRRKERFVVANT